MSVLQVCAESTLVVSRVCYSLAAQLPMNRYAATLLSASKQRRRAPAFAVAPTKNVDARQLLLHSVPGAILEVGVPPSIAQSCARWQTLNISVTLAKDTSLSSLHTPRVRTKGNRRRACGKTFVCGALACGERTVTNVLLAC
jgi:hypothetical protein